MGIVFQLGGGPKQQQDEELRGFAESLGLKFGRATKSEGPQLRGVIDGHKIRVRTSRLGRCEIEVDYDSGLRSFSIYERSLDVRTNRVEINTEDADFDTRFRTFTGADTEEAALLNFLTEQRRQVIRAIGEVFTIHKIKDDEFEVHLPEDPAVETLRDAIDFCVNAAKALDQSQAPQDALRPAA